MAGDQRADRPPVPEAEQAVLRRIRWILTDVDGVLNDGRVTIDEHGVETKQFHVHDGSGVVNLRHAGIPVGLITGRQSRCVTTWARKAGITEIWQGVRDKRARVEDIAERHGIGLDEIAYCGDDILDLRALQAVGYSVCPADARPEVKERVDFISPVRGGYGVLRHLAERVLIAQDKWYPTLRDRYGLDIG